ncbi:uncharacterized protein LOC134271640 isoform X3 [Saccostrea cucullata]|uniref:uncharacterized protein LOC134271640 isoform X3 n=1 Tax=Saccostrea cuccullata TaxID=36930 RepID=UPI002ED6BA05
MEKEDVPPSAPAWYPGPGTSDVTGRPTYVDVDTMPEINPPPSYDSVFTIASSSHRRSKKYNPYEDDRNMWEKAHDCFEMSVLQQIIWLIMLAFSISYIFYGIKYSGQCYWRKLNKDGDKEEEDLTKFIQAEGGVLCVTILWVFLWRINVLCEICRKKRLTRPDMDKKKLLGAIFLFIDMVLNFTVFGLCIAGATKIYSLYDKDLTNYTSVCHPEFYNFYYNAKIVQLVVLMSYAAYILIA